MTVTPNDQWSSGDAYEAYIGRWSRLVAARFLAWLDPRPGLDWLDAGCGTGALTAAVLELANPASVTGIDTSAAFIDVARSTITDERATFEVADAQALPQEDGAFDWTVSALCLNHVPRPPQMLAEMARVTRPGGTVGAYVWDYTGEMQMSRLFWEAAERVDPAASAHQMGMGNLTCALEPLRALFEDGGLHDVDVVGIEIDTVFAGFDDFWEPYEGGTGVAPRYAQDLPASQRLALKEELRRSLPVGDDGSISLIARAWAIRGIR
jgi:SAM-dependent methyltransferase